jgi:hypothetical protein
MIERGENVAFAVQPVSQARMQTRVVHDLDGHGLPILQVVALGPVYGAHAAVAEDGHDLIRTDPRAEQTILMCFEQRLGCLANHIRKGIAGFPIRRQERLDRQTKLRVVAAMLREARIALGRVRVGDLLENGLDLLPARARNHPERLELISVSSHALASRMSRCTVAVDVPAAVAICS